MVDLQKAHILLVEDEKNVGSTLVERLQKEGFEVSWATSQEEAKARLIEKKPDLSVVDIGLPDGSGFQLASFIRETNPNTALIFLTAHGDPEDRIRGLELGAEDYIVKPFHLKEFMLRVQNALRRARALHGVVGSGEIKIGKAEINFQKFEVSGVGKKHFLTHKECSVLKYLLERRGRVVSRDEILNEVWGEEEFPSSRTIDNFIVRFRRLVEIDPENPEIIRSVRGVGYQLYE